MFLEGQKLLPSIPQKRLFGGGGAGRKKVSEQQSPGSFLLFLH